MARRYAKIGEINMNSIKELKKIADQLEGKKAALSPDDARIHLELLVDALESLKRNLETIEDIKIEVETFQGIATQFYKEAELGRMLGLDSNPFHKIFDVGKENADKVNLKTLISDIKDADRYIALAEQLQGKIPQE